MTRLPNTSMSVSVTILELYPVWHWANRRNAVMNLRPWGELHVYCINVLCAYLYLDYHLSWWWTVSATLAIKFGQGTSLISWTLSTVKVNAPFSDTMLSPMILLANTRCCFSLANVTFRPFIHLWIHTHAIRYIVVCMHTCTCISMVVTCLLITLSLFHGRDRSAFIARACSVGIVMGSLACPSNSSLWAFKSDRTSAELKSLLHY